MEGYTYAPLFCELTSLDCVKVGCYFVQDSRDPATSRDLFLKLCYNVARIKCAASGLLVGLNTVFLAGFVFGPKG